MKIKLLFIFILFTSFLFLSLNCKKIIMFGKNPEGLEEDMTFEKGKIYFKEEKLEVRYVITKEAVKEDINNSIIFYFHGLYRNQLEWVEKNGFGKNYLDELKKNTLFKSFPVVSISLGRSFLFLKYLPAPYDADIESLFINKIVPYFKKKLDCNGKVYLIGHSMGGFNALTLSLRNPELFPVAAVISPYVAPISPFNEKFNEKGVELKMSKLQVKILKDTLTGAFLSEDEWYKYNPFKLAETNKKFPFIIMSAATNDLPGFEVSIKDFDKLLKDKGIDHYFCNIPGDHRTACGMMFNKFLETVSIE